MTYYSPPELTKENMQKFADCLALCGGDYLQAGFMLFPDCQADAVAIATLCKNSSEFLTIYNSLQNDEQFSKNANEAFVEKHLREIIEQSFDANVKIKALSEFMKLKGLVQKSVAIDVSTSNPIDEVMAYVESK